MLASIVNLYRLRRALTGQPGLEVRLYRALRSSRKRRHRVRTNPRWVIHYAIPHRVAGRASRFGDQVREAFEILDSSPDADDLRVLRESLALLGTEPARYRDVSETWSDVLRQRETAKFTPLQWRWLAQISGMMGLFRATDQARRRSAESHLLSSTSADTVTRVRALCELGRASEAVEVLSDWSVSDDPSLKPTTVRTLNQYLRKLCIADSLPPKPEFLNQHILRLHKIVGGRRVGIVGNSTSMPTAAHRTDIDVVVRLNVLETPDRHLAIAVDGRPLIVYLNSANSIRLLNELHDGRPRARSLVTTSALITLRAKQSPVTADVFSIASVSPPIHDHGPVIGCQAAFDAILAGASSVSLLGFDFNQSSLTGEHPWDMCRKLGHQGMLNQFEFLRQMHEGGLLDCDDAGAATIRRTTSEYAALLENLYGDWSLGSSRTSPQ